MAFMRLYVFQYAIRHANGAPIPGFLVQTASGENILVDTGWPIKRMNHHDDSNPLDWRMTDDDYVVNRLASIGLQPGDVNAVICTHFDPDHAGNLEPFPHAACIVQRDHLAYVRSVSQRRFEICRDQWDRPEIRWLEADGDVEVAPGVRVIATPGHTPGHQSVLVELPRTGKVVLAIDAAPRAADLSLHTHHRKSYDLDPDAARQSVIKLAGLIERERVALVIYGHDGRQWRQLRHAPEFYD